MASPSVPPRGTSAYWVGVGARVASLTVFPFAVWALLSNLRVAALVGVVIGLVWAFLDSLRADMADSFRRWIEAGILVTFLVTTVAVAREGLDSGHLNVAPVAFAYAVLPAALGVAAGSSFSERNRS